MNRGGVDKRDHIMRGPVGRIDTPVGGIELRKRCTLCRDTVTDELEVIRFALRKTAARGSSS